METSIRETDRFAVDDGNNPDIYHEDPVLTELGVRLAGINGVQELEFLAGQIMDKIQRRKQELAGQERPIAEA